MDAIDLIKRQQTEIEKLKGWERLLKAEKHAPIIKKAKTKAIKNYKEQARQKLRDKGFYPVFVKNALDEVEKEMVGD
jgi:hypothetical protein